MPNDAGRRGTRRRALWAWVLLGAALRFGYVALYPQSRLCNDCLMYDEVGRNLASGRGFVGGFAADRWDRPARPTPDAPEIGLGPMYPGFLALLYRIGGDRFDVVRLAQAAISTLTLLGVFALTSRTLGEPVALTATAVAAIYPAFIFYSGFILTETLTTALLVAALLALTAAWHTSRAVRWIAAGMLTSAAVLLRAELAVMTVPLVILSFWRRPTRHTIAMLAVYSIAIAVTMAPWVVRNWRTFDRFIPVSAHDGDTLWISMKGWQDWHFDDPELQALARGRDYIGQEDAMRDAAVREIRAHPIRFAVTRLRRFPDFWLTSHTGNVAGVTESFATYRARGAIAPLSIKLALLIVNTGIIAAGLFAMLRGMIRRATPEILLMATPVAVIAGIHLVLYATARYQVPMMPFVIAFAATLGARPSNASRAPSSRVSRGTTRGFRRFFAGEAGLLGACAGFSDTLLASPVAERRSG